VFFIFSEERSMSRKNTGRDWIRRGLRVEQLEDRAMLAANITASISGSTLVIRGDSADNQVTITETSSGVYEVSSTDSDVNHKTAMPFVTTRRITAITVDLGKGNDALDVGAGDTAFSLQRNLTARLGDGDDTATVSGDYGGTVNVDLGKGDSAGMNANTFAFTGSDTGIGGSLIVRGNSADDSATIGATSIRAALNLSLGDGENAVALTDVRATTAVIATGKLNDTIGVGNLITTANLTVRSGSGDDGITAADAEIGVGFIVNSGNGDDTVDFAGSARVVSVVTGNDDDTVMVALTEAAVSVVLNTGSGNDGVTFEGATSVLSIVTGNGNDTVAATIAAGARANSVVINTGSQNDTVTFGGDARVVSILTGNDSDSVAVADSEIDISLIVNTGSGIDAISVGTTTVHGVATLDAGSGDDNLNETTEDSSAAAAGVTLSEFVVDRLLTVRLGTGDDSISTAGGGVVVHGNALLDAGRGDDVADVTNAVVDGLFTALMGSDDDMLDITDSSAARVGLNGGAGFDGLITNFDEDDVPPGSYVVLFEAVNV
jgi:hypothetical protein